MHQPAVHPESSSASALLSARERQTLNLLARGFSNREIADLLGVKTSTACTFIKRIYRKLRVHSRAQAVFEVSGHQVLTGLWGA